MRVGIDTVEIKRIEKLYKKEPTFWVLFHKSIQEPKQTIIFLANI